VLEGQHRDIDRELVLRARAINDDVGPAVNLRERPLEDLEVERLGRLESSAVELGVRVGRAPLRGRIGASPQAGSFIAAPPTFEAEACRTSRIAGADDQRR